MQNGKYDLARISETFKVLREHGVKIPQRVYVFDLDGVITIKTPFQHNVEENGIGENNINHNTAKLLECYVNATGNITAIQKLKKIALNGDKIIIHTARHEADRAITEKWLKDHDVPYNELIMGKPYGHFYVDDRSIDLECI